jgi:hypothetical protein
MEGATLDALTAEFAGMTGDVVERRVAAVLGASLPPAERLPLLRAAGAGRGRVGRAMQQWLQPPSSNGHHGTSCRRLVVAPGIELLVDEHHPALRLAAGEPALTDAVRQALGRLLEGE